MDDEDKAEWIGERTAIYIYDGLINEKFALNKATNDYYKMFVYGLGKAS